MMEAGGSDRRSRWTPRPRPEWVTRLNEEGQVLDARGVVPLDEASLLKTAMENTGLDDFGDDLFGEPYDEIWTVFWIRRGGDGWLGLSYHEFPILRTLNVLDNFDIMIL